MVLGSDANSPEASAGVRRRLYDPTVIVAGIAAFGAAVTALVGGLIENRRAEVTASAQICETAASLLGDETPSPTLTQDQATALNNWAISTLAVCSESSRNE
jgi:hypothetical protein